MAALIREWSRALSGENGPVHGGWKTNSGEFHGRAVDIRRDFKQIAIDPSFERLAVIVVWNPHRSQAE